MNLLRLVVILTGTISSTSAEVNPIKDNRIECKIEPINDPALTSVFAGFDDNRSTIKFRAKYDAIATILNEKKASAIDELDSSNLGIEEIAAEDAFSEYNFKRYIVSLGYNAIETAKNEWNLRSEVLYFLFNTGMMIVSELDAKVKILEEENTAILNFFAQNCPTKSLTKCYKRNPPLLAKHVAVVKKWTIAQEMLLSVKPPAAYFKPDWKYLLSQINVPASRFAVAPIQKDLNLVSIWELSDKDTQLAIKTFRENLQSMKAAIHVRETELSTDFELRESVVYAVTSISQEVPIIDLKVVARRVKALERIAEGVIRGLQSGLPLEPADVNKAIKAYLMSVQMFGHKGAEDHLVVQFTTISVPSGFRLTKMPEVSADASVPEAPAETVAHPVETNEKKCPRSSSESNEPKAKNQKFSKQN